MTRKLQAAIIGSGNIGTDLMIKILRHGQHIEMGAMVGIDPASDGLARAARMGVATTHEGVAGLTRMPAVRRHRCRVRRHQRRRACPERRLPAQHRSPASA